MQKMQNFRNHDINGTFFTVIIRSGFFTLKASKTFHKNRPMGRLSNVDRHRALGMVEGGLSYRQVVRTLRLLDWLKGTTLLGLSTIDNALDVNVLLYVSRTGTLF